MTWDQGRQAIERLLADSKLQRVPPSRSQADFLVAQALQHLAAAATIKDVDPAGAYQLSYDAARKALVAVLENQGLRPTHIGGHIVVFQAVMAQLDPPLGSVVRPFNRMRRTRNALEYPTHDQPAIGADDVDDDLPRVQRLVDMARTVMDQMDAF